MTTDNLRTIKAVEVVWKNDKWYVVIHYAGGDRPDEELQTHDNKERAEERAVFIAKWAADTQGKSVEVRVKTKDGKIPKGHHGTATYGYDPEDTKG